MGEMVKTSDAYCKGCKYSLVNIGGTDRYCCNYISITGHSRKCPIGLCDKHEPRKSKKRN